MNHLYGNERKILNIVYKCYKKHTLITKSELATKLKLKPTEVSELCQSLCKKDFLTFVGVDYKPKITAKGVDYFPMETTTSFETIIKSIICPIIVSFITTLLTLLLSN